MTEPRTPAAPPPPTPQEIAHTDLLRLVCLARLAGAVIVPADHDAAALLRALSDVAARGRAAVEVLAR